MLAQQRKHKKALKASLAKFPQVTFRQILDEEGDAATFMDFFLPDEATTRKVLAELKNEGIGAITGIQYWYDNNYHYIKNWEHLRNLKAPAKMMIHLLGSPQDYNNLDLPITDNLMSRLISLVVKVAWTDEQLKTLTDKIESALKKALA